MQFSNDGTNATVNSVALVYGGETVDPYDPAELSHEASKFYPSYLPRQIPGLAALETDPQLQISATRSVKRYPHLPSVPLPAGAFPSAPLGEVLARRRSRMRFAPGSMDLDALTSILRSGYGVTLRAPGPGSTQSLRTTPSAGALYPLDVYCAAFDVDGLAQGLYHFDPFAHVLERLESGDLRARLADATPMPEPVQTSACVLIVTAMFRRTRFKYGQRGFRFALLEAGHLAQNVLLAAEALDLGCLPLGGFYDARVDELLGVDGVNQSALYLLPVGRK
jgi:SagB-type dehydrogenase family enzyme